MFTPYCCDIFILKGKWMRQFSLGGVCDSGVCQIDFLQRSLRARFLGNRRIWSCEITNALDRLGEPAVLCDFQPCQHSFPEEMGTSHPTHALCLLTLKLRQGLAVEAEPACLLFLPSSWSPSSWQGLQLLQLLQSTG